MEKKLMFAELVRSDDDIKAFYKKYNIAPPIKNLSSQDITHVFSANFADDCVRKPCNTYSIIAVSFLVLVKIMLENPRILLIKASSNS